MLLFFWEVEGFEELRFFCGDDHGLLSKSSMLFFWEGEGFEELRRFLFCEELFLFWEVTGEVVRVEDRGAVAGEDERDTPLSTRRTAFDGSFLAVTLLRGVEEERFFGEEAATFAFLFPPPPTAARFLLRSALSIAPMFFLKMLLPRGCSFFNLRYALVSTILFHLTSSSRKKKVNDTTTGVFHSLRHLTQVTYQL